MSNNFLRGATASERVMSYFSFIAKPEKFYADLHAELLALDPELAGEFSLLNDDVSRNFIRRTGLSVKVAAAESARDERSRR